MSNTEAAFWNQLQAWAWGNHIDSLVGQPSRNVIAIEVPR